MAQHKRMRIKRSVSSTGSASHRGAQQAKKRNRAEQLSTQAKLVILFFAVLMGLSMMLPSLSAIFNKSARDQASQQNTSSDTSSDQSSSTNSDAASNENSSQTNEASTQSTATSDAVKNVDTTYTARAQSLESKLSKDPNNLAYLLNLGDLYMSWGASAAQVATTDVDKTYAQELLNKAVSNFDSYLAQKDSSAVRVDRALSLYYQDKKDEAIQALEALTAQDASYPLAWANLGMMYQYANRSDEAKAAYAHAQETDPNDEYGAQTYATQMLAILNAQLSVSTSDSNESSAASSDATSATTTDETTTQQTGVQGLSQTLKQMSGTQF